MPDMEKVIKGLQIERECVSRDCDRDCGKCDLVQDREWLLSVYDDSIRLLKEFELMKMVYGDQGKIVGRLVRCKDCRYGQYCTDGETTYQCFKWNSAEFGELHEQDWFCADGIAMDTDVPNK